MLNLVKQAQKGDSEAFVQLMEGQKQNMYKVARSYLKCEDDVADAMQQTILDCFEKLHTLRQPRFFKTWMTKILINNCNDIVRRSKRIQPMEELKEIQWEDRSQDLMEFLDTLDSIDEKYRTILILYYVEEFQINEIARILDMNVSTVNSRLQRGRKCYKETVLHVGS